jgi:hypothetical protein
MRRFVGPQSIALVLTAAWMTAGEARQNRDSCRDPSSDPSGCQPSTFETPIALIPGGRVDRNGNLDPTSSPREAMAGAFLLERKLGLFRNFEHLHWVPLVPSVRDPVTRAWSGGDLDGYPTSWGSRALGIAGDCLFVGHSNSTNTTGPGVTHDMSVFRIQRDPEKNPPVEVGRIAQLTTNGGLTALRDRESRAYLYTSTDGVDRMLMVRNVATGTAGQVITYAIDPITCLPLDEGHVAGGVVAHEFYLWHDPKNSNRFLVLAQTFNGAPEDLIVTAITDEQTGRVLESPQLLASFTLQVQGGPVRDDAGDRAGLYADGQFTNYSHLTDAWGRAGARQNSQSNALHSGSLSDDGERFYAAGGTAGVYVLNTERIANNTNAEVASGGACNQRSTNVWVDGQIGGQLDVSRLPLLANDCIHTVLFDDPRVTAMLASNFPDDVKRLRYALLEQRSRFDFNPPLVASVGVHSAVPIPNRPSRSGQNSKGRPAYVLVTEETPFGPCPERGMRIVSVEQETTPMLIGTFAMPDSMVENCLAQPATEPDGTMKMHRPMMHAHNPTVFKNIAFVNWQGHGLRAIDISNPFTPRELGHARPVPWGDVMTYPDFKDRLIYVADNHTGLHVFKYVGPRADELPASAVYSSNRTSPHR